jgi:leucyl/phenylalanyl-tRNA--protein transferase
MGIIVSMPVYRLDSEIVFPPAEHADPSGLLAVGGGLEPERLLLAYASGIFPWFSEGQPVLWHAPDPRMVLRASDLHTPRSVKRALARGAFTVTLDRAFTQVVRCCAEAPRPDQEGTWITEEMIAAYASLHAMGFAHSCEAWQEGELVGGLYGVCLGGAFFGESMFSVVNDASKVCFVRLVETLRSWDIELIDCQVHTDHLERFGATLWPRALFQSALEQALMKRSRIGAWHIEEDPE